MAKLELRTLVYYLGYPGEGPPVSLEVIRACSASARLEVAMSDIRRLQRDLHAEQTRSACLFTALTIMTALASAFGWWIALHRGNG